MPRDSFHQSGAMSDSGSAGHGRQYRSNSHANLDQGAFMLPATANGNHPNGFNNGPGIGVAPNQAKTQDRRFERGPIQYLDQYNSQPGQINNYNQRRHKTPNEH